MATPVKIVASEINLYATIIRSCITAINACAKLGKQMQMQDLLCIKAWAEQEWEVRLKRK